MNESVGIIIMFIMMGCAVWIVVRMRQATSKRKKKDTPQMRHERAVWAWGRIINSTHGDIGTGGWIRVKLDLEVHMPGSPMYPATANWLVEDEAMEYVETGKEISLKVDPQDQKYVFPNGPWARNIE